MQTRFRARSLGAVGVAAALTFIGLFGQIPASNAAPAITNQTPPTISIVQADYPDYAQLSQTYPQVGTLLLANPGTWSDTSATFTYAWTAVAPSGSRLSCNMNTKDADGNLVQPPNALTAKSFVPVNPNIGCLIQVTVTATVGSDTATATATTTKTVVGVNVNLTQPQPSWTDTSSKYWAFYKNIAAGDSAAYMTFYGYPDNTPPSADIASPNFKSPDKTFPNNNLNQGIHANQQAGGDGSYANPLTMATWAAGELAYGTIVYVPRLQKYFIAEDQCTECQADMQGNTNDTTADSRYPDGTLRGGDDGGPGLLHFDLWIGGPGGDWPDTILCEDALTTGDMEKVVINPPSNLPVEKRPIFDPATGLCGATSANPNGVDLQSANSVGPYKSYQNIPAGVTAGSFTGTPSKGLCITDPGNGTTIGQQLTLTACNDSRADQNVSFAGMSLMFNNLCLDMGNGMGSVTVDDSGSPGAAPSTVSGVGAWPVTLQRCNLNINQQWELGEDGTIADIQNSVFAFADLGNGKLWATNFDSDGLHTYNYWNYPDMGDDSNSAAVTVKESGVVPGGTLHVSISGLTTPTAELSLATSDDPDTPVISFGVINAKADGTYVGTVVVPTDIDEGDYVVVVQSLSYDMPGTVIPLASDGSSTAITSASQLVVANGLPTLDNFRQISRTVPISGQSDDITIGSNIESETGGYVVPDYSMNGLMAVGFILLICVGAATILTRFGVFNAVTNWWRHR
ncbi:MAG: RICIN domain-containing protein, partial [Propionibacteriaceae bacterium]|nr:RICIN domain-containing protein [Propionibacteriaceae bacterium]